jgi:hypothetical protein
MDGHDIWAREAFGGAELGDQRRTMRLVRMAARAARRPSGKITEVFKDLAERQGAYDFIESDCIDSEAIGASVAVDTARRCAEHDWVYVPMDGTSLKLWDGTGGRKDFGAIGTYRNGATGLKLENALALSPDGVPIGVAAQVWWTRPREREHARRPSYKVNVAKKETRFLLACIDQVTQSMEQHAPGTRCWFQMDRGCDAQYVLLHLAASGHYFTVRSQTRRRMLTVGKRKIWLKNSLQKQPELGELTLDLPETESRKARRAILSCDRSTSRSACETSGITSDSRCP